MNQVILLTGGNLGNRLSNLQKAKELIESSVGNITLESPVVASEAWGFESENVFLNQILCINTSLTPYQLLSAIQKIEVSLGRVRKMKRWISRLIDIDILFFNNELIESKNLTIPHQHIQDRRFTLFALNTIVPDFVHPKFQLPISTLLDNCKDQSKVEVYYA